MSTDAPKEDSPVRADGGPADDGPESAPEPVAYSPEEEAVSF